MKADCGGLKSSMARIFCDLYCIKDSATSNRHSHTCCSYFVLPQDAVVEGDRLINENIEEATSSLNTNMDALMEYYTGRQGKCRSP